MAQQFAATAGGVIDARKLSSCCGSMAPQFFRLVHVTCRMTTMTTMTTFGIAVIDTVIRKCLPNNEFRKQ